MPTPLDPEHPIAKMTPEEKAALPEKVPGPGSAVAAHTLSGVAITEDGRFKKSKYLAVLASTLDEYEDQVYTPEEAKQISRQMSALKNGSTAAIPVICT